MKWFHSFGLLGTRERRLSPHRAKPQGRNRSPSLEYLEVRDTPSIYLPTPGHPGPVVLLGTDGPDQFVIRSCPLKIIASFQFSDDGGATFRTAPQNDVTQVVVKGRAGPDQLTIDNSFGFVAKADGLPISFSGPSLNELALRGDPGVSLKETFTPGSTGRPSQVVTTGGGMAQAIQFTPLASFTDTVPAASLTVMATAGNSLISVTDGTQVDGLATMRVAVSAAVPFIWSGPPASIDFANKGAVLVNAMGGNNTIVMDTLTQPAGLTDMGVVGGDQNDVCYVMHEPPGVTCWYAGVAVIEYY